MSVSSSRTIKITFFVQSAISWLALESVYLTLKNNSVFNVKLILLPFVNHYDLINTVKLLAEKNFSFVVWTDYFIQNDRPDIVFYQMPYGGTYPQNYGIDYVKQFTKNIFYIPYTSEIGASQQLIPSYFQEELHSKATRIFVISKRAQAEFAQYCPVGNVHTVVMGHPKFDSILKQYQTVNLPSSWQEKIQNKTVILWNPTVGAGTTDLSTFFDWIDCLLDYCARLQDKLTLIIRPHPLMFQRMIQDQICHATQIEAFKAGLAAISHVILDENTSYIPAFSVSHCLISDMSSLLITYLITNKPILYLENTQSQGFLGVISPEEIAASFDRAREPTALFAFLERVQQGKDPKQAARLALRDALIEKPDGHCAERIMHYILDNQATLFE